MIDFNNFAFFSFLLRPLNKYLTFSIFVWKNQPYKFCTPGRIQTANNLFRRLAGLCLPKSLHTILIHHHHRKKFLWMGKMAFFGVFGVKSGICGENVVFALWELTKKTTSSCGSPHLINVSCSDSEGGVDSTTATTATTLQLSKTLSSTRKIFGSPHLLGNQGWKVVPLGGGGAGQLGTTRDNLEQLWINY